MIVKIIDNSLLRAFEFLVSIGIKSSSSDLGQVRDSGGSERWVIQKRLYIILFTTASSTNGNRTIIACKVRNSFFATSLGCQKMPVLQ